MENHVLRGTLFVCFFLFNFYSQAQVTLSNPSDCLLGASITTNNCPQNEPGQNPDLFDIQVNGVSGTELGVDVFLSEVRLIIEHTWMGDLELVLRSPSGQTISLTDHNGGNKDNFGDPSVGDCSAYGVLQLFACESIVDAIPPYTDQAYAPEESFLNFNDGTNPNGTWQLQICDHELANSGTLEFIHLVFEEINCLPVENAAVINVDSTTVVLDWTDTDCENTIIEYGAPGFMPALDGNAGEGIVVMADCPPFTLMGLSANTDYDIYIRRYCSDSDAYAANSCVVSASTLCQPTSLTAFENFNSEIECVAACGFTCALDGMWQNSAADDFDWFPNALNTVTPNTGPSADVDGDGKYLYIETSGNSCINGKEAALISNCIAFNKAGSEECHFSFYYHMYGDDIGRLRLEVTNDGINWDIVWSVSGDLGNQWNKQYLAFNQFVDGTILQFRFVATSASGFEGDIALDNIAFYGSSSLGAPNIPYFVDMDGDGFGDSQLAPFFSCYGTPPPGYADNDQDCDDGNPLVNPDAEEILCNFIDDNCNGIEDDGILPPPIVISDTICSGETPVLEGISFTGRPIYWFSEPTGFASFLALGNTFEPNLPANNTSIPQIYTYYVEENGGPGCISSERSVAFVVVNPNPLVSVESPELCPGELFDLNSIVFEDLNLTGVDATFHLASPATTANQITDTEITIENNTLIYYLATNTYGCQVENQLNILFKDGPDISFDPTSLDLCRGEIGTANVIADGPNFPFIYQWSNGPTTVNNAFAANLLFEGTDYYKVTVTDAEGCFSVDSIAVNTLPSIDTIMRSVEPVSACDANDGQIMLTPLDGTPPYTYAWESDAGATGNGNSIGSDIFIFDLAQGSYSITLTDNAPIACETVIEVLVNGPGFAITSTDIQTISCFGASDGELCILTQGDGITFNWNDGSSQDCLSGLSPGMYQVTVSNGTCETILDFDLETPPELGVISESIFPSCGNTPDGSINITPFGGTAPYTFEWSNAEVTEDINELIGGTYTVTITDNNDCTITETIVLESAEFISIQLDSIKGVRCLGEEDGYLQVSIEGGTPPYDLNWNNGSNAPIISNLAAGEYILEVTDFLGCQEIVTYTIETPDPLVVSLLTLENPDCFGDKSGSIEVSVSGGTAPYSYEWSNGQSEATAVFLPVDTYYLTVTDANGCIAEEFSAELTATSFIALNANITQPDCLGQTDGAINLGPTGVAPFQYAWSTNPTEDTLSSVGNLGVGTYTVTVTDGADCIYSESFEIEPVQVFDVVIEVIQPFCENENNGAIAVTVVESGASNFGFEWSNMSTSEDLFGIGDGDYQLTITDQDGCEFVSDMITIESPPALNLRVEAIGEIDCQGNETAYIEIGVEGGVGPYDFHWQEAENSYMTEDIFNLGAGTYMLTITDVNGCPLDTTIILSEPEELKLNWTIPTGDLCDPAIMPSICATATGGVEPYLFFLNGEEPANPNASCFEDLEAGEYILSVEDSRGCITESTIIKIDEDNPKVVIDTFYIEPISCPGGTDGSMTAIVSGGSGFYEFHFTPTHIVQMEGDSVSCINLASGDQYSVTITDLNTGCVAASEVLSLNDPEVIAIQRDSTTGVSCVGLSDGGTFITPSGGTPPYQFNWMDDQGMLIAQTEDLENVDGGTYSLEIIDNKGCIANFINFIVTSPSDTLEVDIMTTDVLCNGETSGSINLSIQGGANPYDIIWNTGATSPILENIGVGTYAATITDAEGCEIVADNILVEEPSTAIDPNAVPIPVSCFDGFDGMILTHASGGLMPYNYQWFRDGNLLGGEFFPDLENVQAGNYSLEISDDNGCVQLFPFVVTQPDSFYVDFDISYPNLPNQVGSITAVVGGGTPDYSFDWNTGATTPTIENITIGAFYEVVVTDDNGCAVSTFTVLTNTIKHDLIHHLNIYPNPTNSQTWIDIELIQSQEAEFILYDLLGRILWRTTSSKIKEKRIGLDMSTLSNGTYMLQVLLNGQNAALEKIILSK